MPRGYVNYEYKGPRWAHNLYSTKGPLQTLRLAWACPKPERFPIPILLFAGTGQLVCLNRVPQGEVCFISFNKFRG